uniref:Uncharacterized protein n=1 Tax=Romanomermis culicivorax TaxID=13658 RepID=A0A915IWK1_ROMCU
MRESPLKAPNLQYLLLHKSGQVITPMIIDDLIYLMENLSDLRQLFVDHDPYYLLLEYKLIKRLCH